MSEAQPRIVELDTLDCRLTAQPWAFAHENREAIQAHWRKVLASKPATFNGEVLLLHRWDIEDRRFTGSYLKTDYASFLAWRDFGAPGAPMWNCFAMAALRASDGAFLLGEMAEHTSNAGMIYFAAGTPDPSDLKGDSVDLAGSVLRELEEETGLAPMDVAIVQGWTAVIHGPRIAMMKSVRSNLPALALKQRIETFLSADANAELVRMHVAAGSADLRIEKMPLFQRVYLEHMMKPNLVGK